MVGIQLQNAGVEFGGRFVFRRINLEIESGECVAIMGSSGVGKTTLIRSIAGLLPLTEGAVRFDPDNVVTPSQQVGVIFQKAGCYPWLTVWENATFALRMRKRRAEGDDLAMKLLDRVGLARDLRLRPHQLSGGMLQRLALVRALVAKPSVLIMDEPFSALDPSTRSEVRDLVLEFHRSEGFTCILVTHDVFDAATIATRVYVLSGAPADASGFAVPEDGALPLERKLLMLLRPGKDDGT